MKTKILATFLLLFALLTLFLSSSIIFDWFGIREKEGNYVLAVVWANFVASILYLISAVGIFQHKIWSKFPLIIALIALMIAYTLLFLHIKSGGLYETKTVGAMAFRIGLTSIFLILIHKFNKK